MTDMQDRAQRAASRARVDLVADATLDVEHVAAVVGADGIARVDVYAPGTSPADGAPQLRVFNPPTLVVDPQGDIERVQPDPRGGPRPKSLRRYRVDPAAALDDVLARHAPGARGGAR